MFIYLYGVKFANVKIAQPNHRLNSSYKYTYRENNTERQNHKYL